MINIKAKSISLLLGIVFSLIYTFLCTLLQFFFKSSFMISVLFCGLFILLIPVYIKAISVVNDKLLFRIGLIATFVIFVVIVFHICKYTFNEDAIMLLTQIAGILSSVAFEIYYNKLENNRVLQIKLGVTYAILILLPAAVITLGALLKIRGDSSMISVYVILPLATVYYLLSRIKYGNYPTFTITVIAFCFALSFPNITIMYYYVTSLYRSQCVLGFDYPVYVIFVTITVIGTICIDLFTSIIHRLINNHQIP